MTKGNGKTFAQAIAVNGVSLELLQQLFKDTAIIASLTKVNSKKEGFYGVCAKLADGQELKMPVRGYNADEGNALAFEFAASLPYDGAPFDEGKPGHWSKTQQLGCKYQIHNWPKSLVSALVPLALLPDLEALAFKQKIVYGRCLSTSTYYAYAKIPFSEYTRLPGVVVATHGKPEGYLF